jgi:hypothetical protein
MVPRLIQRSSSSEDSSRLDQCKGVIKDQSCGLKAHVMLEEIALILHLVPLKAHGPDTTVDFDVTGNWFMRQYKCTYRRDSIYRPVTRTETSVTVAV